MSPDDTHEPTDDLGRPLTTVDLLTRIRDNAHGTVTPREATRILNTLTKLTGDRAVLRMQLADAVKRVRTDRELSERLVAEAIERQTQAELDANQARVRLAKSTVADLWRLVDRLLAAHLDPLHADEWVDLMSDLEELTKRRTP